MDDYVLDDFDMGNVETQHMDAAEWDEWNAPRVQLPLSYDEGDW